MIITYPAKYQTNNNDDDDDDDFEPIDEVNWNVYILFSI